MALMVYYNNDTIMTLVTQSSYIVLTIIAPFSKQEKIRIILTILAILIILTPHETNEILIIFVILRVLHLNLLETREKSCAPHDPCNSCIEAWVPSRNPWQPMQAPTPVAARLDLHGKTFLPNFFMRP